MTVGRRLAQESGITIVEILVACLIFAIGMVAVLGTLDASTRNTFRAEQTQVATNFAQQQLEQIRNLAYANVAMSTTPAHNSSRTSPFYRVNAGNFDLNWDQATQTGSGPAEMAVDNVNGAVAPGGTPYASGDVHGRVYRFVVWRNDPKCLVVCPGSHDYKRVIVIATLDSAAVTSGYVHSYVEVQSDFSDPDATALSTTDPVPGPEVTAQQFFLADTACRQATPTPPSSDHAIHNPLGACSGTGANPPDGLFSTAPADPDPNDPANPPAYDYATDAALEPNPNTDAGLQLLRQDVNGCTFSGGGSSQQYKVHRWLSQPVPLAFVMSGGSAGATLDFYTRTINDVNVPGGICVWLFTRTETTVLGVTTATDTQLVNLSSPPNTYFTFTQSPWPRGAWTRRTLAMNFAPTTLVVGQRLGVAIAVRRNETPQDALEFMYDHPDYPSRLEVKTTTPF
jgi:Tfp pilus assembly protein PilV